MRTPISSRAMLLALVAAAAAAAAAPAQSQVSYAWSRTESVVAAPKHFSPKLDVPTFTGDRAHGWAVLTAAWFSRVVAPALEHLPPVPGLFAAAGNELTAAVPAPRLSPDSVGGYRLASVTRKSFGELATAAGRFQGTYGDNHTQRGVAIEGPLDAHVVPDITNAFRQVCPLNVELEGGTARTAMLVYRVEQGFVHIASHDESPELPATRYLVIDPSVTDARAVPQCYLMYIPAMKAYSFSPYLAQRLQAGTVFTGRLEVMRVGDVQVSSFATGDGRGD